MSLLLPSFESLSFPYEDSRPSVQRKVTFFRFNGTLSNRFSPNSENLNCRTRKNEISKPQQISTFPTVLYFDTRHFPIKCFYQKHSEGLQTHHTQPHPQYYIHVHHIPKQIYSETSKSPTKSALFKSFQSLLETSGLLTTFVFLITPSTRSHVTFYSIFRIQLIVRNLIILP